MKDTCNVLTGSEEYGWHRCQRPAGHPHDGRNGMGNHQPHPLPQDTHQP